MGLPLITGAKASRANGQDGLLGDIARIWQARQDRCESGIIRWKQDEFYEVGAYGLGERVDSIIVDYEFAFKGDGLCIYSLDGLRWNLDNDAFDHETLQQAIYHGEVRMLFAGQRHGRFPAGWICQRETLELGENYNFEAPLLAFRPLAPGVSWFRLGDWDVVSDSDESNGRVSVHLAKDSAQTEPEHLWLDPERGYLPVRHEWRLPGDRLWMRMDTEYAPHDVAGWAPHAWRYVRAGYWDSSDQFHQKVTEGFTSTVTGIELNVSIPDSRFDIIFPPGTRVANERTDQGGIVREDGSIRPIDRAELLGGHKTWDELMHSDPPSAVDRRERIRFWSFVMIGIVCTVGLILYWRRRCV
jgi:hypothetical protein